MKSFVVLCALMAICAEGAMRQKRGWSSAWNRALDGISGGWNTGVGTVVTDWRGDYIAPTQKVIAVNKVVNVQHEVTVPKVTHVRKLISEPHVVIFKKVVPISTGYSPLYAGYSGYGDGYARGYTGGYSPLYAGYSGYGDGYARGYTGGYFKRPGSGWR